MPAYWLARSKIYNAVEYKRYTDLVPEIIGKYNGRVLARGGDHQHMEGSLYYQRHVIIEFPTYEEAVACHQSPEYQDARLFRLNGVGDNELVIVDGGDATT
ncbi:MAG: DUF1330 domain-containing protein [Candidatus Rariloculaceae bacterium]|jgi:uncharacterized protein (DUF1330 family)|nr:hypothetical protein [Gammaproteobacteria bacterium]|tara:strand:- start:70 stop:372 length:303 start_codon:yes stop_codon:yes gene_type:complete